MRGECALNHEGVSGRQISAWLFAAMVPVGLQSLGGNWMLGLVLGGVGMVLAYVVWKRPRKPGRVESMLLIIYIMILIGQLLSDAALSWPLGNSDPAVPLILLALAAWSAQKGRSAASRMGSVLFWVVLVLYISVIVAGVRNVKLKWLRPEMTEVISLTPVIFLLPCAGLSLLKEKTSPGKKGFLTVVVLAAGLAVTAGVLSPAIADNLSNAFYVMCRSLELMGAARRFEALICAGGTVGWFALFSYLLMICGSNLETIFCGKGRWSVWAIAAGAATWRLCGLHIEPGYLLIAGTVFWVALPVLTQGLDKEKKS